MDSSKPAAVWDRFFFRPMPATSLGLFRMAFAATVLMHVALLAPDARVWFGEKGTISSEMASRLTEGVRLNVLSLLPRSDVTVECFLGCIFVVGLCLLVGYQTRVASILVWIGLTSLDHRNPYVLTSGDTLMRNLAFFLMFAPAERAFSLDRYLRVRKGLQQPGAVLVAPWAQRLLQIQVCIMYLSTVAWKLSGTAWVDGTAVYYVLQLDEFRRFPIPAFMHSLWFSAVATWSTLVVELAMGTLVWVPRLRYPTLLCGAFLHLGLEYTLNVPEFQWVVLASFFLFLDMPLPWQRSAVISRIPFARRTVELVEAA